MLNKLKNNNHHISRKTSTNLYNTIKIKELKITEKKIKQLKFMIT